MIDLEHVRCLKTVTEESSTGSTVMCHKGRKNINKVVF
jgi:hypothetical protein